MLRDDRPFLLDSYVLVGVRRRHGMVTSVEASDGGQPVYCVRLDDGQIMERVLAGQVVSAYTAHPDHPDHGYGPHRRIVDQADCTCEHGCPSCAGGTDVAVCTEDDEDWPCAVVAAYQAGRKSARGPYGACVEETTTIGPARPRSGVVVAVDGDRLEIRQDDGLYTWIGAKNATLVTAAREVI